MAKGFSIGTLTLAVGTAQNLAALMLAEGYTGSMVGGYLQIHTKALTDVFMGHDSTLTAANGRDLDSEAKPFTRQAPPAVDPSRIWLFSTAGGDISVTFEPL